MLRFVTSHVPSNARPGPLRAPRSRLRKIRALLGITLIGLATSAATARGGETFAFEAEGFNPLVLRSTCRPSFTIDGIARTMGAGFLLLATPAGPRRTYLMTAQHLFPAPSDQLPKRASAARCRPVQGPRDIEAGPAVSVAGAHPMGPLDSLRDVAAFPVKGWSPGLVLAAAEPRLGDVVWLLASVQSGTEVAAPAHRARVVRSDSVFAYVFDDVTIGLDQTSGGAVVNTEGEVVGLNVGYGRTSKGAPFGVANSLSTLRAVEAQLR